MKILVSFGTRPEAIKMAPVIYEMKKQGVHHVICNTGQHLEMLEQVLEFFEIESDHNLNLMTHDQSLNSLSANILTRLDEILNEEKPDWVLVHGDTTTSVMTAWAAFHKGIPVAHVEAGLRTYKKNSPFPEELNRQITAKLADLHFAPTEQAKENLRNENIENEKIVVTGNTVVDALDLGKLKLETQEDPICFAGLEKDITKLKYILVTGHRRENLGAGFDEICEALLELKRSENIDLIYPVHLNPNVKAQVHDKLGNIPGIHLIDPVNYPEMLWLMMNCEFIISDSGGIQEEAPGLGKKVLVTRNFSERMEGVNAGFSILTGTDKKRILAEAKELLKNPFDPVGLKSPYGDGKASERIINTLLNPHLPFNN
ncbi:non-hydrolyzing UDP-N-acetylglucosamine 2-epimerase [Salinimicrobium gaetbulicola]|uniref:UDP-N-acetylglucosamine 2-epimerase (non-hydrolyzing) n=1 Tax=Salinimicrobium gaetbulicola TaxID=999702 RepID=A0ABW3IIV6_9FLAO